ncbi:sensor histidine kinase [Gordonia humi]|uniref:histidine kinase n=1 Tax=Gordonia humi TaxID=686429 RepID=A0A840EXT6_9ACTN|nr:signal transduction histidine kinase [Gordonia humi]
MSRSLIADAVRPSRWPIVGRSAVAAGVVVALALALGAGALLLLLRLALGESVDSAASVRASDVAGRLEQTSPGGLDDDLFAVDSRVAVVQVVDGRGHVVRTSSREWSSPLVDLSADADDVQGADATSGPDDELRVTTARADGSGLRVMVAASDESAEQTIVVVGVLLAIGAPLIAVVAALVTAALVRRSLSSVDAISDQVSSIDAADLSTRVPVPPTRDEIARLATTMNEMLDRVESGHLAQRRFVGDASHELRSPLATVCAALELASSRPDAVDADLVTGTLLPETRRLQSIVENLLLLARADEAGLRLRAADVDLDEVVAEQIAAVGDAGGFTATIEPARIRGDRAALVRVVRNLLDNAVAHAEAAVHVTVTGHADGARIVVDDDGPGVPTADRRRVFERFVRLDTDRARGTGGTGLGLAIVEEIVDAHGGTIVVCDAPSGGARFVVDLPSSPEPPERRRPSGG